MIDWTSENERRLNTVLLAENDRLRSALLMINWQTTSEEIRFLAWNGLTDADIIRSTAQSKNSESKTKNS
jgi:hypothetical protein